MYHAGWKFVGAFYSTCCTSEDLAIAGSASELPIC
jgi:hypothetical protein